jgi:hypothetical protein
MESLMKNNHAVGIKPSLPIFHVDFILAQHGKKGVKNKILSEPAGRVYFV